MPASYEKIIQYLVARDSHFLDGVKKGDDSELLKKINAEIARAVVDIGLISDEQLKDLSTADLRLLTSDTIWPLVTEKIITREHIEEWGKNKFFNIIRLLNHPRISPFILRGELTFTQVVSLREQVSNDSDLYQQAKEHFDDIIAALDNPIVKRLLVNEFISLVDVVDLGSSDIIRLAATLSRHEMKKAIEDIKSGKTTVAEIVLFDDDLSGDEEDDGLDNFVNGVIWCCGLFGCCSRRLPAESEAAIVTKDKSATLG